MKVAKRRGSSPLKKADPKRDAVKAATFVEHAALTRQYLRDRISITSDTLARLRGVLEGNHTHATEEDCVYIRKQMQGWGNHLVKAMADLHERFQAYVFLLGGGDGKTS